VQEENARAQNKNRSLSQAPWLSRASWLTSQPLLCCIAGLVFLPDSSLSPHDAAMAADTDPIGDLKDIIF
jgi:hypothetical protein